MEAIIDAAPRAPGPRETQSKGTRPGWDGGLSRSGAALETASAASFTASDKASSSQCRQHHFNRRIDRFERRGRSAARSEWRLITATHNPAEAPQSPPAAGDDLRTARPAQNGHNPRIHRPLGRDRVPDRFAQQPHANATLCEEAPWEQRLIGSPWSECLRAVGLAVGGQSGAGLRPAEGADGQALDVIGVRHPGRRKVGAHLTRECLVVCVGCPADDDCDSLVGLAGGVEGWGGAVGLGDGPGVACAFEAFVEIVGVSVEADDCRYGIGIGRRVSYSTRCRMALRSPRASSRWLLPAALDVVGRQGCGWGRR
jgi:hypothetical protein